MTQTEAYCGLADAIVVQAGKDWRALCGLMLRPQKRPKVINDINMNTFGYLRLFFKSGWCQMLCNHTDPLVILEGLERELKETENQIKLLEVI